MQLAVLDWVIIVGYFVLVIVVGLIFTGKAGKSVKEYFVSGNDLPWWIAGTSMVATTFAADTPLAVTGLVANYGIAGNWLWWNMVFSGILTVFLFARLWHRAGVITDVELTELRYSGKPAAILRGFRALYLGLPINCIVIGWVNLAMAKILGMTLGIGRWEALLICFFITVLFATAGGLWGVVVTDFIMFWIAIVGAIVLAFFALDKVGGVANMKQQLVTLYPQGDKLFSFAPDVGSVWLPVSTFVVYLAVNWWATWYPGAEPGGGGYIAQRIFATKNEKHSLLATLWFNMAHYTLRPWPWILVALATMVMYPTLADKESGYIKAIIDLMPVGLRGLMLVSFAAAYMSTISTQLNWGASYLVNDFYRRFLFKNASEKHYVAISRWATVIICILGLLVTAQMSTISGAWKFLMSLGAGTGAVYILRWFWWRINAWSEISAMLASLIISLILQFGFKFSTDNPQQFATVMLITVGFSTVTWLIVTFLTSPVDKNTLQSFYQKVYPGGFWGPIVKELNTAALPKENVPQYLLCWILGCVLVYSTLFGIGKLIFGQTGFGLILLGISVILWIIIYKLITSASANPKVQLLNK